MPDNEYFEQMKAQYHDLRNTLDELAFPLIMRSPTDKAYPFVVDGELAGFMILQPGDEYCNAIYVAPKFRRKGIARKGVLDYFRSGKAIRYLHIVNNNKPAKAFWSSIFKLVPERDDNVDTLYKCYLTDATRKELYG